MEILKDIRFALRKARAERWMNEQLERYEKELMETVAEGSQIPLTYPGPLGSGYGKPSILTSAEEKQFQVEMGKLHDKYARILSSLR